MIHCFNNYWCDWLYSINPIEIGIAALVGIFTGLIASKIFANVTTRNKRKLLDKKFSSLEGTYIRWFEEDNSEGEGNIHAKVHLNHYEGENRLGIRVETFMRDNGTKLNPPQEWAGECVMDTIRSGTVVWEQRIPNNGNNGFKRIIIGKNKDSITLVGESEQGFGVERFTEKEGNTN